MKNCPTCGGVSALIDNCSECEGRGEITNEHQAALNRISRLQKAVEAAEKVLQSIGQYCPCCTTPDCKTHLQTCQLSQALQAIKDVKQ